MNEKKIDQLARILSKQIDAEIFHRKSAPAKAILTLVGAGAFLVASIAIPNLPKALKPFLKKENDYEAWKRFNISYLKRTIQRLERQKLVEITEDNAMQIIKITDNGRKKILKFSLDDLQITKPKQWDKKWRLVSFDLPEKLVKKRKIFVEYLKAWQFYPLHKSVYLHAYPCFKEVDFLREYLEISEHVKMFTIIEIENNASFKKYFDV